MAADENNEPAEQDDRETGAEKKEKKYWPLALLLTLFVLGGGGYYALTGLRDTAHKLGGGADYEQLAANSSVYSGRAAGGDRDVIAGGGELPAAAADAAPQTGRLNPALVRTREELVAAANGTGSASVHAGNTGPEAQEAVQGGAAAPGYSAGGIMAGKLKARAGLSRGKDGSLSKDLAPGAADGFKGNATIVGKASTQSETKAAGAKKAASGGVLQSLKGAFRASFYGARLSSHDSAKTWISRAFDATPEADTAIEYGDEVRAKLDKVNPDSIPNFLREQDLSAAEAKTLGVSEVSKPKMDKDGTYDALKNDADYQKKKLAGDFAGSMINGLFAGVSGTGSPDDESRSFSNPEDEAELGALALGEYMQSEGFGGECGCTADSPCCCLPQDYFSSGAAQQNDCPMYGPFLPDDPCGQDFNSGANTADSPVLMGP